MQDGNYIALKMTAVPEDAVTTIEVVGGTSGPSTLDADMNAVLKIASTTQSIRLVSTKDGYTTFTKTYTLTGLVLEEEPVILTVEAEAPETDLLGKLASDLQTNVVVGEDSITGTLHYVTEYTGFSSDPTMQEGNYIALQMATLPEDAVTTIEVVGGTSGPATLDSDMNAVLKIADETTQTIRVISSKDGYATVTQTYDLTGLVLESSGS